MNKKNLLIVPVLFALLTCSAGCVVVNRAISASAVANNLAVEKAQNEMLLLNVLRGKDHRPMYVTGIAKINGQVKAEASLGVTVPFGHVGPGDAEASRYVASPSATYNWNPNFDVIVFDTSEFMNGFLAPISSEIFVYYWSLGFYPEVLFDLLVLKVQMTVTHEACIEDPETGKKYRLVEEHIFPNNQERPDSPELDRFAKWVKSFLAEEPHIVEGTTEALGPKLSQSQAQKILVKGLKEGLTLAEAGESDTGEKLFQVQAQGPPPKMLKLDKQDALKHIYDKLKRGEIKASIEYPHRVPCPANGSASKKREDVQPPPLRDQFRQTEEVDKDTKMTITLLLRSPEAILYYLGELARLEEHGKKIPFVCVGGKPEPLFVVVPRACGCGMNAVEVTNSDGKAYVIPAQQDESPIPKCEELSLGNESVKPECGLSRLSSCDPGRSMEALTIVAQLIALQKSAKDMPTTSVVRVVGQ